MAGRRRIVVEDPECDGRRADGSRREVERPGRGEERPRDVVADEGADWRGLADLRRRERSKADETAAREILIAERDRRRSGRDRTGERCERKRRKQSAQSFHYVCLPGFER